jgi:hypothetical protein
MGVKYAGKVMGRPLRFCMITTFYPPYHYGGDAVFVQQLSNELAARGHQVEVIHCKDAYHVMGGPEPSTTSRDHPNVTVHAFGEPVRVFLSSLNPSNRAADLEGFESQKDPSETF